VSSQDLLIEVGHSARRLAVAISDRYGVEVDVLDALDLLAESGLVVTSDDGSNHARRAWDHHKRRLARAA
jgi:hypothetical protein